jgi:glycosyltransferase involved in cell wall biosynthesis
MKVSIVIPVYNVEKYICRCIDSVLAQSYKNFEVVVVDDQSPDRSIELVESYQSEKIRIIRHAQNRGLPASRNTGVKHCHGDYLLFLDSDDFLKTHALEKCLATAQDHQSDIVSFNSERINDEGETWPYPWHEKFNSADIPITSIFEYTKLAWDVAAWSKLIKLDFYRWHNIEFDEKQKYFEDHLFSLQLFTKTRKVSIVHDTLHYYTIRNDTANPSITQSKQFDSVLYRLRMIESVISYLKKSDNSYLITHFFELIIDFYRQVLQLAHESAESDALFQDIITKFKIIFNETGPETLCAYHFETVDLALYLKYLDPCCILSYFDSSHGRIKCADTLLASEFPEKECLDVDLVNYSRHYSYSAKPYDHRYFTAFFMFMQPFYLKRTYFTGNKAVKTFASKNLAVFHIHRSGLFDKDYYSTETAQNFKSMRQAITHYVFEGEKSRMQPNTFFNPAAYLEANPDLRHWEGNLFGHFLMHGISKGRSIR